MNEEMIAQIKNFLTEDQKLKVFPAKRKNKVNALLYLQSKFNKGKMYSEQEVNAIINNYTVFNDAATIRREMYNNHLLNRQDDGTQYWL